MSGDADYAPFEPCDDPVGWQEKTISFLKDAFIRMAWVCEELGTQIIRGYNEHRRIKAEREAR